jgi:hypothetical protein
MTLYTNGMFRAAALVAALTIMMLPALAADVAGTWNMVLLTEIGDRPLPIEVQQNGDAVTGTLGEFKLQGSMQGNKLTLKAADFYAPEAGFKAELMLEGTVEGNKITGNWRFAEYSGALRGEKAGGSSASAATLPDGTWNLVLYTEIGDKPAEITLQTEGEIVKGSASGQPIVGTFRDGALSLKLADFYSPDAGFKADLGIQGKVDGDTLQGRWSFAEYSGTLRGTRAAR